MVVAQADKDFFIEILNNIGAPITKENLKFLAAWRQAEGGTASNNPFNTTYKLDADSKKTDYNSVGVKNYTNKTYGIAATTKTLKLPYYKNIVKGLQNNIGAKNIANNTNELKTWGTGAGVARVLGGGKVQPPSIGDGTNPKVYSGSEETKETEEVSPGELAAVEVEEVKKSTPWWNLDDEEEAVAQQPFQQEQAYDNELPYYMSEIPAEEQVLLYGEQMFDEGGIVKPAGDPWEYKKDGDKYLTRKRGSNSWITATGLPEESIKARVFKEIPVSDRVKEATASYTREKRSQPESETPRRKEAWRDAKGVERPKTDAEKRMDASLSQSQGDFSDIKTWQGLIDAGQMSEQEQQRIDEAKGLGYDIDLNKSINELPWEETQNSINIESGGRYLDPNTMMEVPADTPGAIFKSGKELEFMDDRTNASAYHKFTAPTGWLASQFRDRPLEEDEWVLSEALGYDRYDDSWSKLGLDIAENFIPDAALAYAAPWTLVPSLFASGVGLAANIGYDDAWKEKYGDQTGVQYIENDIAEEMEKSRNAYLPDYNDGKFTVPRIIRRDIGDTAGDVIETVGRGIQTGAGYVGDGLETAGEAISDGYDYVSDGISSGADSFGDWTGWYKHGGPHDPPKVKQRRGSRKNYDNKTWTPSGLQFPTSESSHLMMAEYDDDIDPSTGKPVGWVGFPSLFQDDKPYANDQDNWIQMSGENGWGSIYEEAKRRGEVYYFGEDKETALAFGEGSWKDQLPDEAIEADLTPEEVEQYKAGGYIVEEIK
jgi:hypothetical protein